MFNELERTPEVVTASHGGVKPGTTPANSPTSNLACPSVNPLSPNDGRHRSLVGCGPAGGSLLDGYGISARSRTVGVGDGNRRVRRFYQRYFTGVAVGGILRFLTLTTSDKAVAEGYDIHRNFRRLVMRLRRRWGRFEYIGVKEFKGDRVHLHLVFRGEFMAQAQISAMWAEIHDSPVVDIRAVWGQRGGAQELAKYFAKSAANRYWASYAWVFRGWVGWSKALKRCLGVYPAKAHLVWLARLGGVTSWMATELTVKRFPWLTRRLADMLDCSPA